MDESISNELLAFIEQSPSAFHTIHAITCQLGQAGFSYLPEGAHWEIRPGGS